MMICEFIQKHKLLEIGTPRSGEPFAELILTEPHRFVDMVSQSDYYISGMIWYERAPIRTGSTLGFGGPADPRAPQEYFFSETSISRKFDESTAASDYRAYMDAVQAEYREFSLIPSFQLRSRQVT